MSLLVEPKQSDCAPNVADVVAKPAIDSTVLTMASTSSWLNSLRILISPSSCRHRIDGPTFVTRIEDPLWGTISEKKIPNG